MTNVDSLDLEVNINAVCQTGWEVIEEGTMLQKTFRFDDFLEAFMWMTGIAFYAEQVNHHPTWANAFGIVEVTLTTFEAGGLTELDVQMARKMDEAAGHA